VVQVDLVEWQSNSDIWWQASELSVEQPPAPPGLQLTLNTIATNDRYEV
jgi:hypothetical protein